MKPIENNEGIDFQTSFKSLVCIAIIIGLGAGVIGMTLIALLHCIQHLAFGYSLDKIIGPERFLEGVSQASNERKVMILMLCGGIAGVGWALLHRYGQKVISVEEALKTNRPMLPFSTLWHALLQIITIALGSPLGREVAPREIGALFAGWLIKKTTLTLDETKIMVACGAGAAFAAMYNAPLGGVFFIMEILLGSYRLKIFCLAFISSMLAVLMTWKGLGKEIVYVIPPLSVDGSLMGFAIFSAPLFGLSAFWFAQIAKWQRGQARNDWTMISTCLLNFSLVGCFAIYFPALLGNGVSAAQIAFAAPLTLQTTAVLLLLRCIFVWTSLRAGACGGLLTPSLANGALLGVILGGIWNQFFPSSSLGAFAVVGAVSFLAVGQRMPFTAIVLIFEFTHADFIFLAPVLSAVTLAMVTVRNLRKNQYIT